MAAAASAGQQATVETLGGVIERLARNTESLQQAALDTMRAEIDRIDAAVTGRLAAVESLPADVQGVYRELDRVAEVTAARQVDGDRLQEIAVAELRADLERSTREMAVAQQAALAAAAERMEGLASRLAEIEPIQLEVQTVRRELERLVEEVTIAQQAALSAAGEQFSAQARLRALEPLPETVDALRREVIRLSKDSHDAQDATLEALGQKVAPLEDALDEARRHLERLAAGVAATAERMTEAESRMTALDPVPDEVRRQAREVDRLAAEVIAARAEAADRARSLEERLAALELLPADVQGVYRELDKVAEVTAARSAEVAELVGPSGMLRSEIDELRGELTRMTEEVVAGGKLESGARLAGLEQLGTDVAALTQEIERVVQLSTTHDVALAQLAGRTVPLEAAVDDLRRDLGRATDGVAARVGPLESVPADLEAVRTELAAVADLSGRLDQVAKEMSSLRQETLAAAKQQVSSLAGRIRPLQALPAEFERLSEELGRLREQVRVAAEATAAEVAGRTSPLEAGMEALRAGLEGVTADVAVLQKAATAPAAFQLKAVEKQLRVLEPLADDLSAQQEGLAAVGAQVAELEAKLRALEALPADIEGVYAALYRVADEIRTARRDEALA